MFQFSKQRETTSILRFLCNLAERFDFEAVETILPEIGDFVFEKIQGPVKVLAVAKMPKDECATKEFYIEGKKIIVKISDNPKKGTNWPYVMYVNFQGKKD